MTLRTFTQYLIINSRNGEQDPRRWLSRQEAQRAAISRSWQQETYSDWRVWSEQVVVQPELETV